MRTAKSVISLCMLIASSTAFAKDACKNPETTPEVSACTKQELDAEELKLNKRYKQVIASLDKPDDASMKYSTLKKEVIEAQRAWVSFREKDCKAVFTLNEGGTIRTIAYLSCMMDHAKQRTKALNEFLLN